MTRKEAIELNHQADRLNAIGISYDDAERLRRISMTLRRWFEKECGTDNGCIERDETTNRPYWRSSWPTADHIRTPIADKEAGAMKRLNAIMATYPQLTAYVQTDPRGCSLYILTAEQIALFGGPDSIDSVYSNGVAIA